MYKVNEKVEYIDSNDEVKQGTIVKIKGLLKKKIMIKTEQVNISILGRSYIEKVEEIDKDKILGLIKENE